MDEIGDDSRYPPKPYTSSSANRSKKFPLYPHHHPPPAAYHHRRGYLVGDHNGVGEEEYGDDVDPQHPQFDDTEEDSDQDDLDDDGDEDGRYNPRLRGGSGGGGFPVGNSYERYPKRQKKVRSAVSNYEFAPRPRIPAPLPVLAQAAGPIGRQYMAAGAAPEWNEHDKFVLLEVWGDKFLQLGRKSLRSEDWGEVAEKVTEAVKAERTVEQCRGMMVVLKRKYRKERAKGGNSKWGYFRKMDMLFGEAGGANVAGGSGGGGGGGGFSLGCGVDSGEFVFMDTRVYLNRANGNDEMRDSPCGSEGEEEDDDDDGFGGGVGADGGKGLRVLADSVMRFGEIYEKIESSKRDQMVELERMRVDFQKELESQKKLILERAQEEIAKIREGEGEGEGDDDDDDSEDDDDEGSDMDDDNNGGGDVYHNGDASRENANE